jgi:hypothetical protein
MSAGERDMSDTEIWGRCGHEWINFVAWVTAELDEREERAVEAQCAACDTYWDQLEETITVSALLYEAAATARGEVHGTTAAALVEQDRDFALVLDGPITVAPACWPRYRAR